MEGKVFLEKFPIELNRQQQTAVQAVKGPVLLLAVPGSGKTTVLVARLGYMIYCEGVDPSNILTLTYTVAATNDMRERFCSFFGRELGSRLVFKTINSVCAGIIRAYGEQIGKEPFELESDEKVLLGILSSVYQFYEHGYPTESDLKGVKTWITYIKNMMLSDHEIKELEKVAGCRLLDIYKGYCNELRERRRMDYDDQMVYAYRLLQSAPWLLEYYQKLYPYICVDEAQDTSRIQHKIIGLLAEGSGNLFMVGDEDQSIYGFRAAYPDALLTFEKEHEGATVLLMEDNFRSNANIVRGADLFIQKNTLRHPKKMKAVKESGSAMKEIVLKSRADQYTCLAQVAQECREETAVLYRDNESVIPLVDLLERDQIPYRIRSGDLSFFSHRVVVDIQNMMKFAMNVKNTEVFEQIYYKMSAYLNKELALKACEISRAYNISVFTAINTHLDIPFRTRQNIRSLEEHFNQMRGETPERAIGRITQSMGYGDYMDRVGLDPNKVFIMKRIAAKERTLTGLLERMEFLRETIAEKPSPKDCPFILSTIHSSKGLEYDRVYLMDVQDGLFPETAPSDISKMKREELAAYEEERRLFYVGVTRAKDHLCVFKMPGQSSFLQELLFGTFLAELAEGVWVKHVKFGDGIVRAMDGDHISIQFGQVEKQMNLKALFDHRLLQKKCLHEM